MKNESNSSEFHEAELDIVHMSSDTESLLNYASEEGYIAPGEYVEE